MSVKRPESGGDCQQSSSMLLCRDPHLGFSGHGHRTDSNLEGLRLARKFVRRNFTAKAYI